VVGAYWIIQVKTHRTFRLRDGLQIDVPDLLGILHDFPVQPSKLPDSELFEFRGPAQCLLQLQTEEALLGERDMVDQLCFQNLGNLMDKLYPIPGDQAPPAR
jgi:hypothetical protein